MQELKCKICRRLGVKLFLKGERCYSPKCAVLKRPYAPGLKGKRKTSAPSEYGKQLHELQKVKSWYKLSETQFSNYVNETIEKRKSGENVADSLISKIEKRLDNVVFKAGFASSRSKARQLANHGHFLVNGKMVDIPSYQTKIGDEISIKNINSGVFKDLALNIKKYNAPAWMDLDKEKIKTTVKKEPILEDAQLPAEITTVFEFYSR
ncbi:MAG: 30S ribosomal protein S4 [Candidatus Paceibacterota bacterium]|jgi:small subunit ribosomal protein S4